MSEGMIWRKGSFTLSLVDGTLRTVFGYVSGAWGIDRRREYDGAWVITHIPSGCRAPRGAYTLKAAKAAVEILDALPAVWPKQFRRSEIAERSKLGRGIHDAIRSDVRWATYLTVDIG